MPVSSRERNMRRYTPALSPRSGGHHHTGADVRPTVLLGEEGDRQLGQIDVTAGPDDLLSGRVRHHLGCDHRSHPGRESRAQLRVRPAQSRRQPLAVPEKAAGDSEVEPAHALEEHGTVGLDDERGEVARVDFLLEAEQPILARQAGECVAERWARGTHGGESLAPATT